MTEQLTAAHQQRLIESLRADLNLLQNHVKILALALRNAIQTNPALSQQVGEQLEQIRDAESFGQLSKLIVGMPRKD